MAMNVGSNKDDDVMLDVNMTPLIDVMLVLLIMFIITIPIPNNAININLPNGNPPPNQDQPLEPINLRIDPQGKIFGIIKRWKTNKRWKFYWQVLRKNLIKIRSKYNLTNSLNIKM